MACYLQESAKPMLLEDALDHYRLETKPRDGKNLKVEEEYARLGG